MSVEGDADLIADHRRCVEHLLLPLVARYRFGELRQIPEGRDLLAAAPEVRASLAIAALAGPRSGSTAAIFTEVPYHDQWPAELVSALVRRTLQWDPGSAALAIRLVAATDFDDERIQLVLKAADQIAEDHPGHPDVMAALELLDRRVQATADHRYRVPEMRARVAAAIARHTPPELLDLSPVAVADIWGPAARALLEAADGRGTDAGAVLRCLTAAPSSTTPTARWLRVAEDVLAAPDPHDLVRALVRLLAELDLDPDGRRDLVAAGNDRLARAAVWALAGCEPVAGDVALLREVVERCSRTNGRPAVTEALCGKAAGAGVTTLAMIRDGGGGAAEGAAAALETLWQGLDRGDVLRRLGTVLGRDEEQVAERLREAKRDKAARRPRAAP